MSLKNVGWLKSSIIIKDREQYDRIMKRYDSLPPVPLDDDGHYMGDPYYVERTNLMNALMNFNYTRATTNANGKDVAANRRRNRSQK